jgi:hypothetical protein
MADNSVYQYNKDLLNRITHRLEYIIDENGILINNKKKEKIKWHETFKELSNLYDTKKLPNPTKPGQFIGENGKLKSAIIISQISSFVISIYLIDHFGDSFMSEPFKKFLKKYYEFSTRNKVNPIDVFTKPPPVTDDVKSTLLITLLNNLYNYSDPVTVAQNIETNTMNSFVRNEVHLYLTTSKMYNYVTDSQFEWLSTQLSIINSDNVNPGLLLYNNMKDKSYEVFSYIIEGVVTTIPIFINSIKKFFTHEFYKNILNNQIDSGSNFTTITLAVINVMSGLALHIKYSTNGIKYIYNPLKDSIIYIFRTIYNAMFNPLLLPKGSVLMIYTSYMSGNIYVPGFSWNGKKLEQIIHAFDEPKWQSGDFILTDRDASKIDRDGCHKEKEQDEN